MLPLFVLSFTPLTLTKAWLDVLDMMEKVSGAQHVPPRSAELKSIK